MPKFRVEILEVHVRTVTKIADDKYSALAMSNWDEIEEDETTLEFSHVAAPNSWPKRKVWEVKEDEDEE